MRRNRITQFQPVRRRSGVIASVMQTKRSAQTPVSLVRSLSGLALRLPVYAAHASHATGASDARKTKGFRKRIVVGDIAECGMRIAVVIADWKSAIRNPHSAMSIVLAEVHAAIE